MNPRIQPFATVLAMILTACALAAGLSAQVTLRRGAVVYTGSAANTTAPATIDAKKVRVATKEWQEIEAESIDLESARGKQLLQKMNGRVREAVKAVAGEESRDLVVRKKDIADKQGRVVMDLTDKVVAQLKA